MPHVLTLMTTLLALPQSPAPDLIVVTNEPLVLIDNYEQTFPSNCAGHSLDTGCHETLVGIYYPSGTGPGALGYSNPPKPVLIQLRGGNTNAQTPIQYPWFQNHVLPHGFVGVDPNFAPVSPGEDYTVSLADVAYLVQYLRHYHAWLNIDPERIFVFGRSFGGIMSLAVGLGDDAQDLGSPDPVHHASSRPNCVIPFSAMADLNCLGAQTQYSEFVSLWFPISSAPGATKAQKDADSAIHWLTHPELYGRTWTPRICLGYAAPSGLPCGQYDDPHEGGFGKQLRDGIDELVVKTNEAEVGLAAKLIVTGDAYGWGQAIDEAMQWAVQQLQPQAAQFYLVPPKTPIGPTGSLQTLHVVGAQPNSWVAYFAGFGTGPAFVPGCSNLQLSLVNYLGLGWQKADANGQAKLWVWAPPAVIDLPVGLHVLNVAHCENSQILQHTWLQ
ncbi:MAG: hypothetical protein FJ299_13165 [Planctomycetes bacterium]|nr:hypothetical protein [Planctomycetota bacterium]